MTCPFGNDDFDCVEVPFGDPPPQRTRPGSRSNESRQQTSQIFQLARRLQGKGYLTAESCEEEVKKFCRRKRLGFEESLLEFNQLWARVKYPDFGVNGFEVATMKALEHPIVLPETPPKPERPYVLVASIAYYLSEHTRGEPFLLLVQKLADFLKYKSTTPVSGILRWLQDHAVIRCVDKTYSFTGKHRRGRKYLLGTAFVNKTKKS